jgi:phosphate transport system protein
MAKILLKEIEDLKKNFLNLGTLVEESVHKSIRALDRMDFTLAQEIIDSDRHIDHLEVRLEEECLKILALHQPVAGDLRFIIAIMKINSDLERIGDLAVNISKRVVLLAKNKLNIIPIRFKDMEIKTEQMLKKSLDAISQYDAEIAYQVLASDDEVDIHNRKIYAQMVQEIQNNPEQSEGFIHYMSISRFLERIADYATNISEDVIYLVDGEIIRHRLVDIKTIHNS